MFAIKSDAFGGGPFRRSPMFCGGRCLPSSKSAQQRLVRPHCPAPTARIAVSHSPFTRWARGRATSMERVTLLLAPGPRRPTPSSVPFLDVYISIIRSRDSSGTAVRERYCPAAVPALWYGKASHRASSAPTDRPMWVHIRASRHRHRHTHTHTRTHTHSAGRKVGNLAV